MDFFNREGCFGGIGSLDPEVKVIPSISGLPELSVGYHIGVEAWDVGNILQLEQLLACGRVDVDLDLAVASHIGTAISSENRINPIWLLKGVLVETAEVVQI